MLSSSAFGGAFVSLKAGLPATRDVCEPAGFPSFRICSGSGCNRWFLDVCSAIQSCTQIPLLPRSPPHHPVTPSTVPNATVVFKKKCLELGSKCAWTDQPQLLTVFF